MDQKITRVGIVLTSLNGLNVDSLRYLILYQNTLQENFEFSFLRAPDNNKLVSLLESESPVSRKEVEAQARVFVRQYRDNLEERSSQYRARADVPSTLVFLSTAKFSDNFYRTSGNGWDLIALGNWERFMAPPSIIEFFIHFVVRCAVDASCAPNEPLSHYSTKGCLYDFNSMLSDSKYAVLTGFLCSECSTHIERITSKQNIDSVKLLVKKEWLGSKDNPSDVSAMAKKLGYDLFHTSGVKQTFGEKIQAIVEEELPKQILKIVGAVLLASLLLWLGLK